MLISALAFGRYAERAALDTPPQNGVQRFLDEHYPDDRIQRVYPQRHLCGVTPAPAKTPPAQNKLRRRRLSLLAGNRGGKKELRPARNGAHMIWMKFQAPYSLAMASCSALMHLGQIFFPWNTITSLASSQKMQAG